MNPYDPDYPPIEDRSARIIQKHACRYMARLKSLNALCFKVSEMLRAEGGHNPVYLPEQHPGIVLKDAGSLGAKRRLDIMRQVRPLIESLGAKNLILPTATVCGRSKEFLAERRERINISEEYNQNLYLNEPRLFDNAVRQISQLFTKAYLFNLVRESFLDPPFNQIKFHRVRYDNIPLSIRKINGVREGCITFVDTENFVFAEQVNKNRAFTDLTAIFPLHLEIIRAEFSIARELPPYLGHFCWLEPGEIRWYNDRQKLAQIRDDHLAYNRLELTPERKYLLVKKVEKKLMLENWKEIEQDFYLDYPVDNPKTRQMNIDLKVAKQFAPLFVTIVIEKLKNLFPTSPNPNQKREVEINAAITPELTKFGLEKNYHRSAEFKAEKIHENLGSFMAKNSTIQATSWSKVAKLPFYIALDWILPELEGKEIFKFEATLLSIQEGYACSVYY